MHLYLTHTTIYHYKLNGNTLVYRSFAMVGTTLVESKFLGWFDTFSNQSAFQFLHENSLPENAPSWGLVVMNNRSSSFQ